MDTGTKEALLNGALRLAWDVTGLVPGMAEAHGALQIAVDAAPAIEAAIGYFQSSEGQRAIAHVRSVFGAIQPTTDAPIDWTIAKTLDSLDKGEF